MHSSNQAANKKLSILTLILLLTIVPACNTMVAQGHLSVQVGNAVPVKDFASDNFNNEYAAGTTVGISAEIKYLYAFKDSGLQFSLSLGLNINSLKQSTKNHLEGVFEEKGLFIETDYYKFINIPLLIGVNLPIRLNYNAALWFESAMGIDVLQITPLNIYNSSCNGKITFKPSLQFACAIGGGIVLLEKYTVGLYLQNLGKHQPASKIALNHASTEPTNIKVHIYLLSLKFGIIF